MVSVVLVIFGAILAAMGFVEIDSFPKNIAGAIFTVIIGATMTLLTILEVYGSFVKSAEEKGKLNAIKKTFKYPVLIAVIGFIVAILSSTFVITSKTFLSRFPIFPPKEWLSLLMSGLLLYAVIAFAHTFSFIFRVVTDPNTGENDGTDGSRGDNSDIEENEKNATSNSEPDIPRA